MYADAGHRPHAVHTGETPENKTDRGPYGITVTLDTWGPQDRLFTTMYDALQSNWGEEPNRSWEQEHRHEYKRTYDGGTASVPGWTWPQERDMNLLTGWSKLTDGQRDYVESCFAGKTLPQILELLSFEFTVDGVSRACTHQLVRTRIGAAFMQHGGRDNDWRHRKWTMPETIYRAIDLIDNTEDHSDVAERGLQHCITNPEPLEQLIVNMADCHGQTLQEILESYLDDGRRIYAALVDAGIPWQDARRVLWMGTQTYIHACYNYLALQGVCNKRLEFAMDWEINAVAQLMVREVRMKCHPLIGKYLTSLSDKLGKAAYAGLESWTPDGKYDYRVCSYCKHPEKSHEKVIDGDHFLYHCTECQDAGSDQTGWPMGPNHLAQFVDPRPRTHRPEQAPFWVLHPDSMAGGPVKWIPTNGTFPKEF